MKRKKWSLKSFSGIFKEIKFKDIFTLRGFRIKDALIIALSSIFLGFVAGGILMVITGNNPFEGYAYLFQGGLKSIERIGNSLAYATPLILAGLSVAFAFKTGLFNIGASGQMLIGGLCASLVGLMVPLPKPILLPVMMLAAVAGGGIWGGIPGILKAKFNVHEVVSTIMMNWIAFNIVLYFVPAYIKGNTETESKTIEAVASLKVDWLTKLFDDSYINLGFFMAVLVVILIYVILNKTVLGFELKAAGFNKHAAEYSGMKVNRNIMLSMGIAGALAGLAGAAFYVGYTNKIQLGILPSHGFDAIAVSLLAANSSIGIFFASIFFGILQFGKGYVTAQTDIPREIGDIIIATIIYFSAASALIQRFLNKIRKKKKGA